MKTQKENLIVDLTFDFALNIIKYTEELETANKFIVAKQILASGTSIGANVREAQNAESKADFIHKMKIAAKETDETMYWLELCKNAYPMLNTESLLQQSQSINNVLSKIIGTSKRGFNESRA